MYALDESDIDDTWLDVTDVFDEAATHMSEEDVLLLDGFSLYDAMTALEMGDPRMDTGMTLDDEDKTPFDPLAPLRPDELCYILDRSFSAEMLWHSGCTLTQSLFTFVYVHHVQSLNPDFIPAQSSSSYDATRPLGLITVVLRAAVTGLLKCCDLAWREMSKGFVLDTEDWQSDRCELSLCGSLPVDKALSMLDFAISWVERAAPDSMPFRDALLDRLALRQTLLQLFCADPIQKGTDLRRLVTHARSLVERIRSHPSQLAPEPGSQPARAFDPNVTRKLSNTMPLRPIPLPSQEDTWRMLDRMFDGFQELCHLSRENSLTSWKLAGDLHASRRTVSPPFIRSLTQTTFYSGQRVCGTHEPFWFVERFFQETLGTPARIPSDLTGDARATWNNIFHSLVKIVSRDVQSGWFNPPRRRRHLTNSLLDWSYLYFRTLDLVEHLSYVDMDEYAVFMHLPDAVLSWRLASLQAIVLSGFKLELYAAHERQVAYWYLSRVAAERIQLIDRLEPSFPSGSSVKKRVTYLRSFLAAVRALSEGMFTLTIPQINVPAERVHLSFLKRYKWAFRPEYERMPERMPTMPDYDAFCDACEAALEDTALPPAHAFSFARDLLSQLDNTSMGDIESNDDDEGVAWWDSEHAALVSGLNTVAEQLARLAPETMAQVPEFSFDLLRWDALEHRWFPGVREDARRGDGK